MKDFLVTFFDDGHCEIYQDTFQAYSFLQAMEKANDSFFAGGYPVDEVAKIEVEEWE